MLDLLLVLVIVAWGTNLSVIKVALAEFPVHAFNALRMVVAGAAFALVLWQMRPEDRTVERSDRGISQGAGSSGRAGQIGRVSTAASGRRRGTGGS